MSLFLHLLFRHLRQYPGRSLLAVAVMLVSSTLLLALAGVAIALQTRVGSVLEHVFPSETVQLEGARGAMGPLAMESQPLGDETLAAVRALPQVESAWAVEAARFPFSVEGVIFNQYLASDAVVYGAERELVADALPANVDWQSSTPVTMLPLLDSLSEAERMPGAAANFFGQRAAIPEVPVVVSRYFLDMYNLGLSRSSGLPALNPQYFIGKHIGLALGASSIGFGTARQPARYMRGRIVGFTAQPGLLGLAVPAAAVKAWNEHFAIMSTRQYVLVIVKLRPGADRDALVQAAAKLSLVPGGSDALAGQLKAGVRAGAWGLGILAVAVLALGLLSATQLFALLLHARRQDLMRLRAMGLSARRAALLALGEVAILAAVGSLAGAALVWGLLQWAARVAAPLIERLPWLPADILVMHPAWLAAGAAALIALAILPVLPLLLWVGRTEPAMIIRDL